MTAETARFPEIGGLFHASGMKARKQELANFFARHMERGELRPGDPTVAARQFLDLCRSDFQRMRVWNVIPAFTDAELEVQVNEATEAFMRLYAPDPA